jgi:hypothetical protein
VKRWQPPLPAPTWKQVRPALSFGATCETAEQCLFLNVNTPWPLKPDVPGKGLAVMLFIHGGCNKGGAGSAFRTEELVAAAKDVIVVTLNYRLGVFGWLGGKEVAAHAADGSSGNFGTQDQRAGMQWVRENIAAFGKRESTRETSPSFHLCRGRCCPLLTPLHAAATVSRCNQLYRWVPSFQAAIRTVYSSMASLPAPPPSPHTSCPR